MESESETSDTEINLDEDPQDEPAWSNLSWGRWGDPEKTRPSSLRMSMLGDKIGDGDDIGDEDDEVESENRVPKKYTGRALAMHHLKEIVGTRNLNRRIKRVKGVNTKEGAEKWIRNKGLDKRGYKVSAKDIDGDGISDILIKTANGQLAVVNGYTVKPSDFAYRQFFDSIPPKERHDAKNYKELLNQIYALEYGPDGVPVFRGIKPDEIPLNQNLMKRGIKPYVPRKRSPYQTFTVLANELFNNVAKVEPRLLTPNGKHPQSAWMAAIAYVWTHGIVKSELESLGKSNAGKILARNPKAFPKTRNSKRFKEDISNIVSYLRTNPDDPEVQNIQHALIEKAIEFTEDYNQKHGV